MPIPEYNNHELNTTIEWFMKLERIKYQLSQLEEWESESESDTPA